MTNIPHVVILGGGFGGLAAAGPKVSEQILDLVNSEKIIFHNSCKIKSVKPKQLIFENGEEHDFDLLLSIPPHIAPKIIYDSGLAKEPGFISIDRDCKTPFENVFAVGDVTSSDGNGNHGGPKGR